MTRRAEAIVFASTTGQVYSTYFPSFCLQCTRTFVPFLTTCGWIVIEAYSESYDFRVRNFYLEDNIVSSAEKYFLPLCLQINADTQYFEASKHYIERAKCTTG